MKDSIVITYFGNTANNENRHSKLIKALIECLKKIKRARKYNKLIMSQIYILIDANRLKEIKRFETHIHFAEKKSVKKQNINNEQE